MNILNIVIVIMNSVFIIMYLAHSAVQWFLISPGYVCDYYYRRMVYNASVHLSLQFNRNMVVGTSAPRSGRSIARIAFSGLLVTLSIVVGCYMVSDFYYMYITVDTSGVDPDTAPKLGPEADTSLRRSPVAWLGNTDPRFTSDCCSLEWILPSLPEHHVTATEFKPNASGRMTEEAQHRKSAFDEIFEGRLWGGNSPGGGGNRTDNTVLSASGAGSTWYTTTAIRGTLECLIDVIKHTLNKKTLRFLDIPCGDMQWMSRFLDGRSDIRYTGMDIVHDLIAHHVTTYSDKPWKFKVHDLVSEPLPASYDLIMVRDMTQHLTSGDNLRVLRHLSISGSHFVLLSTYPFVHNVDELSYDKPGRSNHQNLELSPYSLTPPLCARRETKQSPEYNALWRLPLKQWKWRLMTLLRCPTCDLFIVFNSHRGLNIPTGFKYFHRGLNICSRLKYSHPV